jgi:hypothetical protein
VALAVQPVEDPALMVAFAEGFEKVAVLGFPSFQESGDVAGEGVACAGFADVT